MIHAKDDITPRMRNCFRPEEYFTLNVRNGVLRSPSGARFLTLPEEFITGLTEALEDETGAAAPVVLYSCGRWWGRQFARRLFAEIRQFYKVDAASMPTTVFLQIFRRIWSLYGWGKLDISFELRDHGFIEAIVENPIVSDVVGTKGRPSEQLASGILAAVVSELAGRELECVQTMCLSKGDPRSMYLIGISSRTEVIAEWLKQGKNHSSVRESISAGDLV